MSGIARATRTGRGLLKNLSPLILSPKELQLNQWTDVVRKLLLYLGSPKLLINIVPSGVLLRHPTQTPFQTEDEHRYFLTFRDRTAMLLSEYFNSAVWNKLMLQLCHREAFIAHAIVAIGALDKTMESGLGTGLDGSPSSQRGSQWHHEFALQQYSKALSLMRNTAAMGYLNCILSCVLTTCFESFHGNQESALAQAQAGLSLMVEWQDKIKASRQEPDACSVAEQILDPEIEDDLGLILGRLDREVWSFGQDTRPIQQHKAMYEEGYLSLERMPRNFTSLKEARRYYDLFARQTVRWRVIHHAEIPSMVQMLPSRTFRKVAVGDPSTPPQFSADIMEATRHGMLYFKGKGKQ